MKLLNYICFLVALTQLSSCQQVAERDYEIRVEVKDDAGNPISSAEARTARLKLGDPILTSKMEWITPVATNDDGIAIIKYRSLPPENGGPAAMAIISKNRYYDTKTEKAPWIRVNPSDNTSWKAEVKAVLKLVKKPIPMLARRDLRIRTPEFGKSYGFDLELGEALPPFGKGHVADLVFKLEGSRTASDDASSEVVNLKIVAECPNSDDGLIEFLVEDTKEFSRGSALPSSNEAPENGYINRILRTYTNDPDGGFVKGSKNQHDDENKCYYFRIRSRTDANGKIISAHYGKMYGPLEIRPAMRQRGHDVSKGQGGFFINYLYFNPTPNDRNVEFDPKRNLNPAGNVNIP